MLNKQEVEALCAQLLVSKEMTPKGFFEMCKKEGLWLCINTEQDPILSLEIIEGEDNVIASVVIDGDMYDAFRDIDEIEEV